MAGTSKGQLLLFKGITAKLQNGSFLNHETVDPKEPGAISNIALSPSGQYLAMANHSRTVWLWRLADLQLTSGAIPEPLTSFQHTSKINSLQFDKTGEYLYYADERQLRVMPTDVNQWQQIVCFTAKELKLDSIGAEDWHQYLGESFDRNTLKPCQ